MISRLQGTILEVFDNAVTVDVQGVGYEVSCTSGCLQGVRVGKENSFVIFTDVKEDSIRLYGFQDVLEKRVFLMLLSVKGVGAKSALEILSRMDRRELVRFVGSGEAARLQSVRGIGKKTAERIIVELKDRFAEFVQESRAGLPQLEIERLEPREDAVEALQALGFSRREAELAVKRVEISQEMDSGAIVKEALQYV